MFAIVKFGNQQFKVKAGDFIRAPYQNVSPGDEIEIPVLGFGDEDQFVFSADQLKKSKVKAILLRQSLSKKVLVFKKKRRKGYRKTKGHRQKISELKVLELCSPDGKVFKVDLKKPNSKKSADKKVAGKKVANKKAIENKTSSKKAKKDVKSSAVKEAKPVKSSDKKASSKKAPDKKVAENKTSIKKASRKKTSQPTVKKNTAKKKTSFVKSSAVKKSGAKKV